MKKDYLTRSVRDAVNRSIRHDEYGWINFFRIVSRLLIGTVLFGSNEKKKVNFIN